MASRRKTMAPNSFGKASTDTKSSKGENVKANNSGTGTKSVKSSGTTVKSRYMQPVDKPSLSKSNSSNSRTNEPVAMPPRPSSPKPGFAKPRVATPPRRLAAPMAAPTPFMSTLLEPSLLEKSALQSTFADGPRVFPDFDVSVINDTLVMQNAVKHERTSEKNKTAIEMQTFLLAYITAKMDHNTAKLKEEAEARLLHVMEEEERLYNEVQEKKRKYLLQERNKQTNEILDLQIAALTPLVEEAQKFKEDYRTFARAIDTTRHELPVKNCYIEGDGRVFLDKSEACLEKSEKVLVDCTATDLHDSSSAVECLRDIKAASKDITQQIFVTFSELQELSSQVSLYNIKTQQAFEEHQLGPTRTRELYCPEP
ncbi:HAUS augmin-like complex subunit 8 [Gadus macrocephalus]|uniref:HAUS augmin-like complex subunit 8 n=1 Tax=Gadus macrocephalus TaxID=80720 RepID=UPI0028CB17D5|nr:HAUS augmin-like complex subunit 8 [Gadus macrocephalus]